MNDELVERFAAAQRDNTLIDLTDNGPADMAEGYDIQDRVAAMRGSAIAAWKIGATNEAAQQLLGLDGPFAGSLAADGVLTSPVTAALADLPGPPVIEAEIGLRVDGNGEVIEVVPCIEFACSRLADMLSAGAAGMAADNGAAHRLVIGGATPIGDVADLVSVATSLTCDGEPLGGGTGADVLGDPRNAVTWLAEHLAARGQSLGAGALISTGALAMARNPAPGRYVADYGPLGTVEITLT